MKRETQEFIDKLPFTPHMFNRIVLKAVERECRPIQEKLALALPLAWLAFLAFSYFAAA